MAYIGMDNGRTSHQYCVLRDGPARPIRGSVANDSKAFEAFCQQIEALFPGEEVVVGLEEGGGLSTPFDVVMQAHGWSVRQLTPWAVNTYRQTVLKIHDKTDDTDAFTMAKMLQVEAASVELSHERASLRRATRWRSSLVVQQTEYINQLRDTLARYWPESAGGTVFPDIDLYWVLDLLANYPDPVDIAATGTDAILKFLRERGSSVFRKTIERVVEAAERNSCSAPEKSTLLLHTRQLASLLRLVLDCIVETEKAICAEVESDPDVRDIDAIRGISTVQAATFIAEVRSVARFEDESHLASYSGFGRRKVQTGKTKNTDVQQRHANRILKRCILLMTETLSLHDARSRLYYKKKITEGQGHRSALRCLGRHFIRRLFAIMTKNQRAFLKEATPEGL